MHVIKFLCTRDYSVLIKQIKFSTTNAYSFTGEQSFKFGRGGGGLWEGRVTVSCFEFLESGPGLRFVRRWDWYHLGVRVLGVTSLEGLTLLLNVPLITPPLRV